MSQSVGSIHYDLGLDTDKFETGISRVNRDLQKFANVAKLAAAASAIAFGAAIVSSIKSAASFESSLSQLRQASGATGEQLKAMSVLARNLGRDNSLAGVTAANAAESMTELSKAGLSVKDTMAATRGVLSLAKAGNIEFADAAIIAASALNAFGLKGKDATMVADMLAAGANASQAKLEDLAAGMQQSATVAKQFQLSLKENVTALALFANNGIRGSDAGTSLKTMLISLAKPSDDAAAAMKEIGFSAYDSNGKFVGLEKMALRLKASLKGLTKQQQQNTLATIFGTDAFRAAGVLADSAGKKYTNMSKAVGKAGAAQDAARAQMGAFERATEGLSNQLTDVGLTVGNAMLPALTRIVTTISGGVLPAFNALGAILTNQVPLITVLGITVGGYATAMGIARVATTAWAAAQLALNNVMKANPLVLVASLAIGLATAYMGILNQTNSNKSATDRLNQARRDEVLAADNAKAAEDRLKGAKLTHEGATLALERAIKARTEAEKQFGIKSLEFREADHQVKVAKQGVADALTNIKIEGAKAKTALDNVVKAKEAVKRANNEIAGSANNAAVGFQAFAKAARDANDAAKKGNTGKSTKIINDSLKLPQFGGYASGGFTGQGGVNDVAGIVHRGEYVLPKSAVDQASGMPKTLGSTTIQVNMQGIMARSRTDLRDIAKDLVGSINEELRAKNMAQIGGGML